MHDYSYIVFNNIIRNLDGRTTIDVYKTINGNVEKRKIELENEEEFQEWRTSQGYNKPEKKLNKSSDINSY